MKRVLRKPKQLVTYALLCACLGIWGYVLFQMAHGFVAVEDKETLPLSLIEQDSTAIAIPLLDQQTRRAKLDTSYQDPFAVPAALFRAERSLPVKPSPAVPDTTRPVKVAPPPPPLTLSGIVGDTALLLEANGTTHIGRVGEAIGNVRILQIEQDRVTVQQQGRRFVLKLE